MISHPASIIQFNFPPQPAEYIQKNDFTYVNCCHYMILNSWFKISQFLNTFTSLINKYLLSSYVWANTD